MIFIFYLFLAFAPAVIVSACRRHALFPPYYNGRLGILQPGILRLLLFLFSFLLPENFSAILFLVPWSGALSALAFRLHPAMPCCQEGSKTYDKSSSF
ncbi:MAG TPA: hypothetical protein H9753_04550 [Candidatus Blautia merdavium]|uniref:Uncharacterized protein n=1 Tax=Candidatus Blautia merdavium TaxID=2838494 RepID=A0A9D2PM87_9FIRM|nr:hypothetical protein [Candidatus Blautia merdavium]